MSGVKGILGMRWLVWPLALLMGAPMVSGESRLAGVFVLNRLGEDYVERMGVLEDLVTGALSGTGLGILSREVVLNAVSSFSGVAEEGAVDALLSEQSSALRLAQNLGADYVFVVSLTGFDAERRDVRAYGVAYTTTEFKLRLSYRMVDGGSGQTVASRTVTETRSVQEDAHSKVQSSGIFNDLAEQAAEKIAMDVKGRLQRGEIAQASGAGGPVNFTIRVSLSDIAVPQVVMNADGTARVEEGMTNVEALAVAVDVDGITVGTSGSALQTTRGLHRVRLSREDLVTWERMVNVSEGMELNVVMQLNESGWSRWREKAQFLQDLKSETVLTAATAEVLRGQAQMLRQSGFKWDIKVDTNKGLTFEDNRSVIGR